MLCGQFLTRLYFLLLIPPAFLAICDSCIFALWGLVKNKPYRLPGACCPCPECKQPCPMWVLGFRAEATCTLKFQCLLFLLSAFNTPVMSMVLVNKTKKKT